MKQLACKLGIGLLSWGTLFVPLSSYGATDSLRETHERITVHAVRPKLPNTTSSNQERSANCQTLDSLIAGDRGPYSDLLLRLRFYSPEWLRIAPSDEILIESSKRCFRFVEGVPISACCDSSERVTLRAVELGSQADLDGDGIPNALDILLGAKKAALLGSRYVEAYRAISLPNGDVPRAEGGTADVVVRALRNAGYDLQVLLQEDRQRAPKSYAGIVKPDPNIDHRRVRNLLPYFERNYVQLSTEDRAAGASYLPGDIVFLDNGGDNLKELIGIVSDRLGQNEHPLIIGSWAEGHVTQEMELPSSMKVTRRFRVVVPPPHLSAEARGLDGWLNRQQITIPSAHQQVVVVLAPLWSSSHALLSRYERKNAEQFVQLGQSLPVRLGANGMAVGSGFMPLQPSFVAGLPQKRDDDSRTPIGIFELGTAFGWSQSSFTRWPFRQTDERDYWVKDPKSTFYNTWKTVANPGPQPWLNVSERLDTYELAVAIRHNEAPIEPGAGSAVFLYSGSLDHATTGSTCVAKKHLETVIRWLDEAKRPLLLQTAGYLY